MEALKAEHWRLRNEKLRTKLDRERGKLIDKEDLARRLGALCAAADAFLGQKLEVELAALAGCDAAALRAAGERIHDRVCRDFQGFAREWAAQS